MPIKQLMLAAIAAVGFSAASHAEQAPPRTWWVFDFEKLVCLQAAKEQPEAPTPEAFRQHLREWGLIDDVNVKKDNNGNILSVTISTRLPLDNRDMTSHWFLSEEQCRNYVATRGYDPNDLR